MSTFRAAVDTYQASDRTGSAWAMVHAAWAERDAARNEWLAHEERLRKRRLARARAKRAKGGKP